MVEERIRGAIVFNQPAGHVEDGESILEAVVRETLEETAWHFRPRHLLGIYLWRNAGQRPLHAARRLQRRGPATIRAHALDRGILAAHWMTPRAAGCPAARLRSPLVLRCIDDYLAGRRYGLDAAAAPRTLAVARGRASSA